MQIDEAHVAAGNSIYFNAKACFSLYLPVAVAMELPPTMLAALYVCENEERRGGEMRGSHNNFMKGAQECMYMQGHQVR